MNGKEPILEVTTDVMELISSGRMSEFFKEGCRVCDKPSSLHGVMWVKGHPKEGELVGDDEEKMLWTAHDTTLEKYLHPGIFRVCILLKRLEDRTNFLGSMHAPSNPVDPEVLKEISS